MKCDLRFVALCLQFTSMQFCVIVKSKIGSFCKERRKNTNRQLIAKRGIINDANDATRIIYFRHYDIFSMLRLYTCVRLAKIF